MQCAKCKGRGFCGSKSCPILAKFKAFQPTIQTEFSGSSPPEIFIGRYNYPNVFAGILSPTYLGDTEKLSLPEIWYKEKADISQILSYRSSMIYSRFTSNIKEVNNPKKFLAVMQEVALASKSADMEFKLEKKPEVRVNFDQRMPVIGNPASLSFARFRENVKVERKVDYLVNDLHVKSVVAMKELHKANIPTSNIIKLLSAGLLGEKKNRKLVPTRWAITATDSNLSELMIDEIRYFPVISNYLLFNAEYLGNHYEILLLPDSFSFEVMEAKLPGSVWNPVKYNPLQEVVLMQDYEDWHGRKDYAENVAGGYYAVRLPVAEYLSRIKRQASVLVIRECKPEYWAPCGVGVLRECTRNAFQKSPEQFDTLQEALDAAQTRMLLPPEFFKSKSQLLHEFNQQKRLSNFF